MKRFNQIYVYMLSLTLICVVIFTSCQKSSDISADTNVLNSDNILLSNEEIISTLELASTTTSTPAVGIKANVFYGPTVQIGKGHGRTWAMLLKDGTPRAIGIEMTDSVFYNPEEYIDPEGKSFVLKFHNKAEVNTPYRHVYLNWNPHGHPPTDVFDLPHFDIHFYTTSVEDRMAIPPFEVNSTGFDAMPNPAYIPANYIKEPGGVPQMGAHWVDTTSHEFPPLNETFDYTFVFGSYAGKVTFWEPMVTVAVFTSGAEIHKPIKQPTKVDPENLYYPTQYSIWKSPKNARHYVSLDNMEKRHNAE